MKLSKFFLVTGVCALSFFTEMKGQETIGNNGWASGLDAGHSNTTGSSNNFFGYRTGYSNTVGNNNSFLGNYAGENHTTGNDNSFFGQAAGNRSTIGNDNSFFGKQAGYFNTTGNKNLYLGVQSGFKNKGDGNIFIGYASGANIEDESNSLRIANNLNHTLIIGNFANNKVGVGFHDINKVDEALTVNGSIHATEDVRANGDVLASGNVRVNGTGYFDNQLTIDYSVNAAKTTTGLTIRKETDYRNHPSQLQFIRKLKDEEKTAFVGINDNSRDFFIEFAGKDRLNIKKDGKVGIGTTQPDELLTVNGNVHAKGVLVDLNFPAPDYVFASEYELRTLEEVENYIKEHRHLPAIPSAKEMEKNGVELLNMNMILLEKVEELTLYTIEQEKRINEQVAQTEKVLQLLKKYNVGYQE